MKLEELTERDLVEIVRLYEEYCGFRRDFRQALYHHTPSQVLGGLRELRFLEYRIGSRWDSNSKVYFKVDRGKVIVSFNLNFDPKDRAGPEYEKAKLAGERFVRKVREYLEPKPKR